MKSFAYGIHNDEYYRGNDLGPGNVDSQEAFEGSVPSTVHNMSVEAKVVNAEGISQEREKEIEQWMENIKSFIRKIDISSL